VQVISGYQLPYKNEKLVKAERALSVQVRVVGVEDDAQCDRTKIVKNNGLLLSPSLSLASFFAFVHGRHEFLQVGKSNLSILIQNSQTHLRTEQNNNVVVSFCS